jgi:Ca2+-binding RTX toxin-like protein
MMGYPRTHLAGAPAAADPNLFVTDVHMKVATAYTIATPNMPEAGTARHVTLTRTFDGLADTPGTVTITGKNLAGETITEILTPSAVDATLVEGVKWFHTVTGAQGAGWIITAGDNDHIVIGCGADTIIAQAGAGTIHGIAVNTTAAGTITVADASGTIAVLAASIVEDFYPLDANFSGYLSVVLAAASDITVLHSGSMPSVYAMS